MTLKESLTTWTKRVVHAYESGYAVDTYSMLRDVDKIIADYFGHERVLEEDMSEGNNVAIDN